jgi:hypothetical protein
VFSFTESLMGDQIREALDTGETLALLSPIRTHFQGEDLDFSRYAGDGRTDPRTQRIIQGFSFLAGGVQWNTERQNLWFSGSAGWGAPDSWAARAWWVVSFRYASRVMRVLPPELRGMPLQDSNSRAIALTDRRLAFFVSEHVKGRAPGEGDDVVLVLSVPRDQITHAVRRPTGLRLFSRGRVEVSFVDGSMIELRLGTIRGGRARRFVTLLGRGPVAST